MKKGLFGCILLLLILFPAYGHAQSKRLRGRIVDAQTKQPIPFVLVAIREDGISAFSNHVGRFRLRGLNRLRQDSLRFVADGYDTRVVPVQCGRTQNLAIQLTKHVPTPAEIAAAVALQRRYEHTVLGVPGTQYAFWMQNDLPRPGRMRALAFFLGGNGFPKEEFRVRIYRADGPEKAPGTDLLTENVLCIPAGPLADSGWYRMDVMPFALLTPPGGYFVAVEFALSGRLPRDQHVKEYAPTGPVMRPPVEIQHQRVWLEQLGKGWKELEATEAALSKLNAMIRVELD